jgi:hypothetical protein
MTTNERMVSNAIVIIPAKAPISTIYTKVNDKPKEYNTANQMEISLAHFVLKI